VPAAKAILTAETEETVGEQTLIALVWVGRMVKERAPWKVHSSSEGELMLCHPAPGEWNLAHPELPMSPAKGATDCVSMLQFMMTDFILAFVLRQPVP
jgi:hypothetical protein